MESFQHTIYMRDILRGLKAEKDREEYINNINTCVTRISNIIINTARTTTKTTFNYPVIIPDKNSSNYNTTYNMWMDVIEKLKEKFIDVSIEYKFQTDIRNGRELNHGIYIDWS